MSYTAPAGNAVDFNFTGAYTAPAGDAVDFAFTDSSAFELTVAPTLPALAATLEIDHAQPAELTIAAQLPTLQPSIELFLDSARDLTIAPTLPAIQPSIELERGVVLEVAATLPTMGSSVQLQWGDTIPTVTLTGGAADASSGYRWGRASTADAGTEMGHNDAPAKQAATAGRWQDGEHHNAEPAMPYSKVPSFDSERDSRWTRFEQWMDRNTELPDNYPLPTDLDRAQPWADFVRQLDRDRSQDWNFPPPVDVVSLYQFQRVDDYGEKLVWDTRDYTPPRRYAVNFDFTENGYTPDATALNFSWGAPNPYPNQPIRPTEAGQAIAHNAPPAIDESRQINWGAGSWTRPLPDYVATPGWNNEQEPPAERPPQPQIREVYIFMPSVTLYRTPDGAEIEATNVSWSTDSDSWAWRFSATLQNPAQLALLKPDSNGPREIACIINGHEFTGLVRGYSPTRSFEGGHTVTINGVSLSGWLSEPHAPARSKLITAPYTAQQLAELELQNTGWTLDWQTQDWLIPAGAYSYESLTPISAIKRIADAVGAIVQSHPANKTLIVKPRYPVSPHKWTDPAATLDAILPADLIQQIGADYTSRPVYNRAIIAGGKTGGVIVTVTRDGTAGDVLAPQITDDLITDQYAGYERGRIEIARGGAWETLSLTAWLTQQGEAPGLLLPGHLIELQDTDETYPVQITGTSVSAQSSDNELTVRQTLTAERSVTNA
jgi:hypothetical protein